MPNKIYGAPETAITFSSGGTPDFSPESTTNGNGRISAQHDRGAGSKPAVYEWFARFRANAAPTVGTVIRVYLIQSNDATHAPGDLGTTDANLTTENGLLNATFLGAVVCDAASTTVDFAASGLVEIRCRYLSVAWWNATGQTLHATGSNHEMKLTPVPDEIQ